MNRFLSGALAIAWSVLSAGPSLQAQTVPFVAKIREVESRIGPSAEVTERRKNGMIYRASDGSTLTVWLDLTGKPESGELLDNQALGFYKIEYQRCRKLVAKKLSSPQVITPVQPKTLWEQDTVGGISCSISPVWFVPKGGVRQRVGTSCWSDKYAFELRHSSQFSIDGVVTIKREMELYDIQVNTEPPASVFYELQKFVGWGEDAGCKDQ